MKKKHGNAPTKLIIKSNPKNGLKNDRAHPANINNRLNPVICFCCTYPKNSVNNLVLPTLIKHGNTVNNIKKYKLSTTNTSFVLSM
jgi:hypothetical protein